jgi:hypothetical protein
MSSHAETGRQARLGKLGKVYLLTSLRLELSARQYEASSLLVSCRYRMIHGITVRMASPVKCRLSQIMQTICTMIMQTICIMILQTISINIMQTVCINIMQTVCIKIMQLVCIMIMLNNDYAKVMQTCS